MENDLNFNIRSFKTRKFLIPANNVKMNVEREDRISEQLNPAIFDVTWITLLIRDSRHIYIPLLALSTYPTDKHSPRK
jgi:hypothetical protein